jgi:hypothetical protein
VLEIVDLDRREGVFVQERVNDDVLSILCDDLVGGYTKELNGYCHALTLLCG